MTFFRDLTPAMKDAIDRHIMGNSDEAFSEPEDGEWLSECCGAPPHEATPDVGEDNPAGICGQCREHCGFERRDQDAIHN